MKVVMLDPASLKPFKKNAKPHTEEQIEILAGIISRDGFDQPIVVDKNKTIIKGHGRTLASLQLGLDEVPVIVRDDLSAKEVRLSRIVDNETVDTEWDAMTLHMELKGIGELEGKVQDTLIDELEMDYLTSGRDNGKGVENSPIDDIKTKHECDSCGYKW